MSRLLGTHAFDKQISKGLGIEVATVPMFNFGLLLESRRGINEVVEIFNMTEFYEKFGHHSHDYYGAYVLDSFFNQLTTVPAKAFVKRYVPSDAISSSKILQDTDTTPENTLLLAGGYRGIADKGKWANDVGFTLNHSNKTTTAIAAAALTGASTIKVDSVTGFQVGDAIVIEITAADEFFKITQIIEESNSLVLDGTIAAVGGAVIDDVVKTLNFDLSVYYRNDNGAIGEPKEIWYFLSMENEVSNHVEKLINDPYKGSKYIRVTDMNSTSDIEFVRPAEQTTITFLAGGANGTDPINSDWQAELINFDIHPVRLLANAESQTDSVNQNGETYCRARGNCIWLAAPDSDLTFDEAKLWGSTLLVSGQNYSMSDMQWFGVDDPIGDGDNPIVEIPPVGITAGYWFQTIFDRGFHKNPAGLTRSITGVRYIVMDIQTTKDVLDDLKRTELADLGVNVFQFREGRGFVRRSARMFSSNKLFRYAAGMFMKAIIKESVKSSVETAEMEAVGWDWLNEVRYAVIAYMNRLYISSTNNGPEGAFFVGIKSDGSPTTFNDVVTVLANESNNTNSSLLDGEANIDVGFIPPPPAESIFIGVGINIMRKEA